MKSKKVVFIVRSNGFVDRVEHERYLTYYLSFSMSLISVKFDLDWCTPDSRIKIWAADNSQMIVELQKVLRERYDRCTLLRDLSYDEFYLMILRNKRLIHTLENKNVYEI